MRKPLNEPTRLHADCTLGVMVAVGLALACGLAAYGPIPITDEGPVNRSTPLAGRVIPSMVTAAAAVWGLTRRRTDRAAAQRWYADPPRALWLSALAWALITAVQARHDVFGLWVVSQGLVSAACLLLLAMFVREEIEPRMENFVAVGGAALLAGLGPLMWWLGLGSSALADARWMAATQAIALAMLVTGAVHHGTRSRQSHAVACTGACLAVAVAAEWATMIGHGTGSAALLAWLPHCGAVVGIACAWRGLPGSALAPQALATAAAPLAARSDVDLSLNKQRMAS